MFWACHMEMIFPGKKLLFFSISLCISPLRKCDRPKKSFEKLFLLFRQARPVPVLTCLESVKFSSKIYNPKISSIYVVR